MAQSPKSAQAGGTSRTSAQAPSSHVPAHYLRRLARRVLLRAAVRGRISWLVALQMLALLDRMGGAQ